MSIYSYAMSTDSDCLPKSKNNIKNVCHASNHAFRYRFSVIKKGLPITVFRGFGGSARTRRSTIRSSTIFYPKYKYTLPACIDFCSVRKEYDASLLDIFLICFSCFLYSHDNIYIHRRASRTDTLKTSLYSLG